MLDLTTPTRRTGDNVPLLGTAGGALALKVCGGSHRGRVIQIRAPKCTIGSAAGCTLRLRATGVRPLHCWILRGPAGTVVRRCASGTLLNGLAYEDAPLRRGDRLRVGMVELEVVDCPERPAEPVLATVTQPLSADDSYFQDSKLRELELSLTAANDEIARLEADAQQAWQTSITAAERAEQLRVALEKANVEAGEVRGELETAQAALTNERQQRQQQPQLAELQERLTETEQKLTASAEVQARSARELSEQAARLASERAAFERQQHRLDETERKLAASTEVQILSARELAEQAARFASERETLERQLEQLRRDVEQARAPSGQQAAQMTITMDQVRAETQAAQVQEWQERCAVLEADLQRTRDELSAACQARDAAGQWESRYQEADKQVEHWQAAAHVRQSHIEELQQQLAAEQARQTQVDAEELQRLEEQRREIEQQREALADREEQLSAAHRGLTEFESELKRGREALDAERSQQQSSLDEQAAQVHQRAAELEAQAQEFVARQTAQEQAREQLAEGLAACETRQQQLTASEAELALRREELAAGHIELQRERERLQLWVDELQAQSEEVERRQSELDAAAANASANPATAGEPAAGSDSQDLNGMDSVLSRLVQSGRWRDATGQIAETPDGGVVEPVGQTMVGEYAGDPGSSPVAPEPSIEREYEGPAAQEEPEPVASPPALDVVAGDSQEEESIEKYMERLMQRVRGDSTSAPRPPIMPVLQKQLEELPVASLADNQSAEQEPVKPEEYLPRSQAPEQSANLAAMRELANTAARTAIEHHHQKSGNKQVAFKLLGAGVLLLGSALLGYWAWQMSSVTAAVGAGIGLLTGSLWALRGFFRMLSALRLSRPQPAADAPEELSAGDPLPNAEPVAEADTPAAN